MKLKFRMTNIFRLIGIAMIIGGSFLGTEAWEGFGVSIHTNALQVIGSALVLYPFIREFFPKAVK